MDILVCIASFTPNRTGVNQSRRDPAEAAAEWIAGLGVGSWSEGSDADGSPVYTAEVPADDRGRLMRAWIAEDDTPEPSMGALTAYGHLTGDLYQWDGMDWNVSGVTPFAEVSLFVSDPLTTD